MRCITDGNVIMWRMTEYCSLWTLNIAVYEHWILRFMNTEYCSLWTLNIAVYKHWILQFMNTEYCSLWTLNIAVYEHSILQFMNTEYCSLWTLNIAVKWTQFVRYFTLFNMFIRMLMIGTVCWHSWKRLYQLGAIPFRGCSEQYRMIIHAHHCRSDS